MNLYEALRQKRNELARQAGVKPFRVLHNKTLEEIARVKPETLEELLEIKGIGPKKLEKYGAAILEVVKRPDQEKEIEEPSKEKIFSVGELINFLNELLIPQKVTVQGEIGEINSRGNFTFFKLLDKDEEAVLSCFVWQSNLESSGFELEEGLEIKIAGFPKIYKRRGSLDFQVEHLGLVGEGALKIAFDALKKKLSEAGFFAPERKKEISPYVERIGLITSVAADAKTDFLTHLGKFSFGIYFYDVRVGGLYATDDIVAAIRWFNENMLDIEVLVLTRGGGSLENLQAFNSEVVAKAIFGSKIPVITGIGHESDETIADLVADRYTSTPTDAARFLSDPWREAKILISNYQQSIFSTFARTCARIRSELSLRERFFVSEIRRAIVVRKRQVDYFKERLSSSFREVLARMRDTERTFFSNSEKLENQISARKVTLSHEEGIFWQEVRRWLDILKDMLSNFEQRFKLVDPTARLKQGYSIVRNTAGDVIKTTKQIKISELVELKFYEGEASSRVEEIKS